MLWLQFIICSTAVVISGVYLSKYGDVIAEKTGLGRAWVGLIMMASITSLPELITGITSVTIVGATDIALGDIMGSCIYNLALLAVMDFANGKKPLFFGADRGHILSAGFGVLLLMIVLTSMTLAGIVPSIAHIGLYTPVIIIAYAMGIRAVYYYEKRAIREFVEEASEKLQYGSISLKKAVVMYTLNALVIVAAATWLPFIADALAKQTGLGRTFMGTIFVAMTTSLPELVVSIAAVRIGAQDMAIANMLGSNMFNILVLAVDDVFFTTGPLFSHISPAHMSTGLMAVLMTAVVIIGLTYPPERKVVGRLTGSSYLLLGLWALAIYVIYVTSAHVV